MNLFLQGTATTAKVDAYAFVTNATLQKAEKYNFKEEETTYFKPKWALLKTSVYMSRLPAGFLCSSSSVSLNESFLII